MVGSGARNQKVMSAIAIWTKSQARRTLSRARGTAIFQQLRTRANFRIADETGSESRRILSQLFVLGLRLFRLVIPWQVCHRRSRGWRNSGKTGKLLLQLLITLGDAFLVGVVGVHFLFH